MHTTRAIVAALLVSPAALSLGHSQSAPFPEVGEFAPVFTVKDHESNSVTVGGRSDTWTVLAFYPKALTGG